MKITVWVFVLLFCVWADHNAFAEARVPAGEGTRVTAGWGTGHWVSYDVTDGLTYGALRGIFQDRDGMLWFVTEDGVSLFDGQQFVALKDDGFGHWIRRVCQDRDGKVWLATSGGVMRYDPALGQAGWRLMRTDDGLVHNDVFSVYQDDDGVMWFGTRNGLSRYHPSSGLNEQSAWTTFTQQDGLPGPHIDEMAQDEKGNLWVATHNGVARYDGQNWVAYSEKDGLAGYWVRHVLRGQKGDMWFGLQRGLSRFDGQNWTTYLAEDGLGTSSIGPMMFDDQGDLWCSTYVNGVSRFDGQSWRVYNNQDGLAQNLVNAVFQDREGHYWFGTPAGVSRYDEHFTTFTMEDGLPYNVVNAMVHDQKGNLWFGTREGVCRYDGKTFTTFTDRDGLGINPATKDRNLEDIGRKSVGSIFEDRDGNLWFGVGGLGVSRYDGKTFVNYHEADGLATETLDAITQGKDGQLWFGGTYGKGISRFDPSGRVDSLWTTYEGRRDGLRSNSVRDILVDRNDIAWVGLPGGLARYDGQTWSVLRAQDGLPRGTVRTVFEDRDGHIWVGARGGGIGRYNGEQWQIYTIADGLANNVVNAIYQDDNGHMWFGTGGGGVSRFDGEVFQTLTKRDGLASNAIREIVQDGDGRMWFATANGVTVYKQPEAFPPVVAIASVTADRQYDSDNALTIPSTADVVTITYGSMSFKTRPGGMVYRYRLKGYEETWTTTRASLVVYEDLPTGNFVFEIEAIDRDLVYSEKPAMLTITVQLPYERIGLWSGLVIALALAIGQTARVIRRDRRLKETQAQLIEEMEKELQAAHDMQMGLMPDASPQLEGIEMSGICIPAREVGGDYYTFLENFGDEKVGFVVADVSGKGMQAATIVMRFNEMLVYEASGDRSVNEILNGLDSSLRKRTPPEMFATCGIGVLDLKQKTLSFDSAACPEVYHYRAEDQSVQSLGISGLPLGMALDIPDKVFGHVDLSLSSGDVLVFTSDGVEEAQTLDRDFYGEDRLAALVEACGQEGLSAEGIRDRVVADVVAFVGEAPQTDDLTVVVVKVV